MKTFMKTLLLLGVAGLISTCPQQTLALGPGSTGGGNTVGDQLFDDYINEGTERVAREKIASLAAPTLNDLRKRLPKFADQLKEGINGLIWYLESKPLKQDGPCVNESSIAVPARQVVRACQNLFDVRIDKKWSESRPDLLPALIIHELLVYQRLHHFSDTVTDDGLYAVSREIRNSNPQTRMSPQELQDLIRRAGFGDNTNTSTMKPKSSRRSRSPLRASGVARDGFFQRTLPDGDVMICNQRRCYREHTNNPFTNAGDI